MHPLLDPSPLATRDALVLCRDHLRRRWGPLGAWLRLLPADRRDDLCALFAWHDLVRERTQPAADEGLLGRRLNELRGAVDEVYARTPGRPIASALVAPVGHFGLSAMWFHAALEELARSPFRRVFQSRNELQGHAQRLVSGETHMLLRVLGRGGERDERLAQSLALGLQLAEWTVSFHDGLARGQVHVAIEDLTPRGVKLMELLRGASGGPATDAGHGQALAQALASQARWARECLARGWPLCHGLDAWGGRRLAFLLRWRCADLAAMEARGFRPGPRPRAGWLRLAACGTLSLATRSAPRF